MSARPDTANVVWIAVASCLLLLVLLTGDWIRNSIGQPMRFALCVTGAAFFAASTLVYIASPPRPFGMRASASTAYCDAGETRRILHVEDWSSNACKDR